MEDMYEKIKELATKYRDNLKEKLENRLIEMQNDDNSHYLIYRVLGISEKEGKHIDIYQNKGRFLYKYAGSFLEEATFLCFKNKFSIAKKEKIENIISTRPKTFEIDCLIKKNAYEIKWKDATTDGDHITKEHTRVKAISAKGYKPIRIMFYYPNREQAKKVQETLETIYKGVNGEYYHSDEAWNYVKKVTGVDLFNILEKIAKEREKEDGYK